MGGNQVIECGVDYITLTATSQPKTSTLYEIGRELVHGEVANGNDLSKWRSLGYTGLLAGSASVGEGRQGVIVRLSSGVAREHWFEAYPFASNVTRLDLQLTSGRSDDCARWMKVCWRKYCEHMQGGKAGRTPKAIVNPTQPETIMFGSRQSERYGRVYDKFLESKLEWYQGCLRFEVEYKGGWATRVVNALKIKPRDATLVTPWVCAFFQKYALKPGLLGCAPANELNKWAIDIDAHIVRTGAHKSASHQRSLTWLDACVRPVVQRLLRAGLRDEILQALKLKG